jgi:hypothetical protein
MAFPRIGTHDITVGEILGSFGMIYYYIIFSKWTLLLSSYKTYHLLQNVKSPISNYKYKGLINKVSNGET